ncbi:MAG TPA: TonB-dependent receptor [Bryobacteraceae bacterium]|nr:TonB-dependent receptor [Bryobacteraceae bacterium]
MTTLRMIGCSIALLSLLPAQEYRATLTGRVLDSQGAIIPNVRVLATQIATNANFETFSGSDGQYTLPFLPPGSYRILVEALGFKLFVRDGIRASTGERIGLDITLEIGSVNETITVSADRSLLETATASTGQVIRDRQIENMPMNGRTPLVLAQLAFGVVPSSDPKFTRPFDNAGPSTFSMGGAPTRSNELLLDGAPNSTGNSRVAYNPPVDAVEEVKVETFQADAAYGHTGGGTVNVVMKGGTNTLHGNVYEFNQVSRLAATPFFTNRAGLKKPVTRYNQWGVNVGGPVVIPKLVNGRDKVFFFFAYEGIKDAFPEPLTSTVPTAEQRNGDFSQLLTVGSNYQIYDPLTGVAEGARVRRMPFANNVIPAHRLSAIAKNYLQFYPMPNQPGRADGQDNFLANTVRRDDFNSELGRLDFNINDRHKLFGNFRHNEALLSRGNRFNNIATGIPLRRVNWGFMVDDVYTFTPTMMLNTRAAWTRFSEANIPQGIGFDMTTLGFPSSLAASSTRLVLPRVAFDRYTGLGETSGNDTPFDIFQIFSALTKVVGQHSLKAGVDLRLYRESSINFGNSSGLFTFGPDWTRGPLDNATAAPLGQDFASFLLGLPTSGGYDVNAARTNQAGYYALFLQNDFRARSNLTLNLGIRYERDLPTTERYHRSVNGFDFVTPNPISESAAAAYRLNPIPELPVEQFRTPGGLLFAGPDRPEIYRTKSHYFSPRFGFAWTPAALGGKTVIRGGFGVFFFGLGTTGINALGFSQTTPLVATLDGFLSPAATLDNPFPDGIRQPTGSAAGLSTFLGQSVRFYNSFPQNPYSNRWNISFQRALGNNLVMEAGYVGNHTVHLAVNRQLNFVPREFLSTSGVRDAAVINRMTANVVNPFAGLIPGTPLDGGTIRRSQLLGAFPHFITGDLIANRTDGMPANGVILDASNDGSSYFHMLQVRLEKRFSGGLQFLANYQYSKLIEKISRLNDSDLSLEKRIAAEDRPQRFVMSASYELPFGKGKPFLASEGPVLGRLAGGWILNAIFITQPGPPLNWGNVIYWGGDLSLNPRRIEGAFDTTRFNTNSQQQLDWNVRTFPTRFSNLRQDGVKNMDLSIIKNTAITEKISLQYRCEFFNAFNRPAFDPPNLSPTNSNFGRITNQPNLPRIVQMALRLSW